VARCVRVIVCRSAAEYGRNVGEQPVVVVERAVSGADEQLPFGSVRSGQSGIDVLLGERRCRHALLALQSAGGAGGELRQHEGGQRRRDRRAALLDPLGELGKLGVDGDGPLLGPRGHFRCVNRQHADRHPNVRGVPVGHIDQRTGAQRRQIGPRRCPQDLNRVNHH
jgi:hypothetical protein